MRIVRREHQLHAGQESGHDHVIFVPEHTREGLDGGGVRVVAVRRARQLERQGDARLEAEARLVLVADALPIERHQAPRHLGALRLAARPGHRGGLHRALHGGARGGAGLLAVAPVVELAHAVRRLRRGVERDGAVLEDALHADLHGVGRVRVVAHAGCGSGRLGGRLGGRHDGGRGAANAAQLARVIAAVVALLAAGVAPTDELALLHRGEGHAARADLAAADARVDGVGPQLLRLGEHARAHRRERDERRPGQRRRIAARRHRRPLRR